MNRRIRVIIWRLLFIWTWILG